MTKNQFKVIGGTSVTSPFDAGSSSELATKKQKREDKREKLTKAVMALLEKLEKSDSVDMQLNTVIALESKILAPLFDEFVAVAPNPDRSTIGAKFAAVLKHIATLIITRREMHVSEEVNPHAPKFQVIFTWFLEVIQDIMVEEQFDQITIDNFFNKLSQRLAGWEGIIEKRLKGLSSKALDQVTNPLVKSKA